MTADLHRKFASAALAYDERLRKSEARRGPVNIYRIGLILEAIERAEQAIARGQPVRGALCRFFNDRLLDAMLKAAGEPKATTGELRGMGVGS